MAKDQFSDIKTKPVSGPSAPANRIAKNLKVSKVKAQDLMKSMVKHAKKRK